MTTGGVFLFIVKRVVTCNYNDIKFYVIYINQSQRTFYFISQIIRSFFWGFSIDSKIS